MSYNSYCPMLLLDTKLLMLCRIYLHTDLPTSWIYSWYICMYLLTCWISIWCICKCILNCIFRVSFDFVHMSLPSLWEVLGLELWCHQHFNKYDVVSMCKYSIVLQYIYSVLSSHALYPGKIMKGMKEKKSSVDMR